ncbi:MAG: protein translocase subunit SecD [Candidatus Saccharibacteria bacterium]|nr:protein translocase subunit SecD [Pseudorhodobacter sp.]
MLYTPLWKRLVIWGVIAIGVILASPNMFYSRVESRNDAATDIAKAEAAGTVATPEQTAALSVWPNYLPSALVNLGLDLRGGAHLLAEVKLADVYKQRMNAIWPEARNALIALRDQVGAVKREPSPPDSLRISVSKPEGFQAAVAAVKGLASNVVSLTGAGQTDINVALDGQTIVVTLSEAEKLATDNRTLQQSLEIIRRRVDAAGTREPSIQRQGTDRILIEVPGIGSAEELKAIIGTTAKLTFNQVLSRTTDPNANPGAQKLLLPGDRPGEYYIVDEAPVVTGEELTDAQPSFDQNNRPAVSFKFNVSGARKFGEYTGAHVGEPFAIVLDNKVISAPTIQTAITGGSGIITGNFTLEESTKLAVLLRAGALPAEMTFLEERTVGPELGQDSIDAGRIAALVGMGLVSLFMIASYGLFGVFADVALFLNMALIFGCLSLIGGTLTLPGIAGIVLTIGMAVDANVLVYERIREELRTAHSPARAIEVGYERALSAIVDANLTTLITAAVLYFFGAGPGRGFAVALGIGIITSVFSAIYVTRLIIEAWFNWRKPKTIIV